MSKNTNWLLLILLVFTSQTLAAPFVDFKDCASEHSYSEDSIASMQHHDMDSMPAHDMSTMDMSSNMAMGCCADDCQCSDGMCVTTVYFSSYKTKALVFTQHKVVFQESQFSYNQFSSSIYRPPILS